MTTERPSSIDFALPWIQAQINDPAFPATPTHSVVAYPRPNTENSLLAISLANSSCVRAIRSFHHRPPGPSKVGNETRMLVSLGDGVNGHSGYCAGGFIGILVDEATGQCAAMAFDRELITAEIRVGYKKMIPTPSVVLCRSWIEKEPEGKKVWVKASIENGEGIVYAEGDSLFIRTKPKL